MAPEKKIVGRQGQITPRLKQQVILGRLCYRQTPFPAITFMIDFSLLCRRRVKIDLAFLRSADACSA